MNGQSGILVLKVEISTNNQACPPPPFMQLFDFYPPYQKYNVT